MYIRLWEPACRLVEILAWLHEHPGADSSAAKRAFGVVTESDRRNWGRDLAELRARNLIRTGTGGPGSTDITLTTQPKPKDLFLSTDMHAVLHAARARLGRPLPLIGPVESGANVTYAYFDVLTLMLRLLEEHPDDLEGQAIAETADLLGMEPADIHLVLDRLADSTGEDGEFTYRGIGAGLPGLELDDGFDVDGDWNAPEASVGEIRAVLRRYAYSIHDYGYEHTEGRGLALVGRFAYSLDECNERLDLIAEALDRADLFTADEVELLTQADLRIGTWRGLLAAKRGVRQAAQRG